ncbi:MAG: hypothetical protein KAV44_04840 [Bacteroidales bacterium]|jgi:hypothetical protein|nr:hypothetical protein [Bacteroidales bacterium]
MKEYIKLPETKVFPLTILRIRELDDTSWKNYIFLYLLQYYKQTDTNEIIRLIQEEQQKERKQIETAIKRHIRKCLKNNIRFLENGFIINLEPSSEGIKEGFYDLKFEHSYWNKYFSFECKNLENNSSSIKEYVYNPTKNDGGVYRFMINKYVKDWDFGGMIGFVLNGEIKTIIGNIIKKLNSCFDNIETGKLTEQGIIKNSIAENTNTFDSIHIRLKAETEIKQKFRLHHIIMDFSNV